MLYVASEARDFIPLVSGVQGMKENGKIRRVNKLGHYQGRDKKSQERGGIYHLGQSF